MFSRQGFVEGVEEPLPRGTRSCTGEGYDIFTVINLRREGLKGGSENWVVPSSWYLVLGSRFLVLRICPNTRKLGCPRLIPHFLSVSKGCGKSPPRCKKITSGAKAQTYFQRLTARVHSRPSRKRSKSDFFRSLRSRQ